MTHVKTNGVKAWVLAARPKTLTGAAAPVLVGGALAFRLASMRPDMVQIPELPWIPFLLALAFALVMQVEANFVNDYFDFKKGSDRDDRLGPERACAQGWVTPSAMKRALAITALAALGVGLPLICYGGWEMLAVGILCLIFCWLYTTHLSYLGLGDLLVVVFFGIVPVVFTCFVITRAMPLEAWLMGCAMGLATDCLLVVNNYRDINQDRISGKRTLIVMVGKKFGRMLYLLCGCVAAVTVGVFYYPWSALLFIYLALHIVTYRSMGRLDGRELNQVLGATARNIFIFGVLTALSVIL